MTYIWLTRHPQSQHNAEGRWAGWSDSPLTPHGQQQARDAAKQLTGAGITRIVTSDLQRAHHAGRIIAEALSLEPPHVDPRWRERNAGHWQDTLLADISPSQLDAWKQDPTHDIPGGENYANFRERILHATRDTLTAAGASGPILVIAHDGVQQALSRELRLAGYPWPALDGPRIPADRHDHR